MDYDKYPDFTIIRVFERETLGEIIKVIIYYAEECVILSLTTTTTLLPRAIKLGEIFLDFLSIGLRAIIIRSTLNCKSPIYCRFIDR